MKILYIPCLCGHNLLLACKYKKLGFEIRNISALKDWKKESEKYGLKLPFKVIEGIASEL